MSKRKRIAHADETSDEMCVDTESNPEVGLTSTSAVTIEYAVTQLQQSIRQIIKESLNTEQLRNCLANIQKQSDGKEVMLAVERNQKLQLAARLKDLYENGKLKIFEQIADFNESIKLKGSSKVRLKVKKQKLDTEYKTDSPNMDMPPLPKIEDPVIEARVFTHRSAISNSKHLSKKEILESNNERLEFLGDSIINSLVTQILFERYPSFDEGELSILRSQLVSNSSLGEFSEKYGFPEKLVVNFAKDAAFQKGKHKIYSDVFEAYVGGLCVDSNYSNLDRIKEWLDQLITPQLSKLTERFNLKNINNDAKAQLYALIGSAALHPRYVTKRTGNGFDVSFVVQCMIGDEIIGEGEGPNLKQAGLRAAEDALSRREVIEKYVKLREATPKEVSVVPNTIQENTKVNTQQLKPQPENDNITLPARVPQSEVDAMSSDKLYAILSKSKILPVYKTVTRGHEFETTLLINNVAACISSAPSKKKSRNQCAAFVLAHPGILPRCHAFVD
ncbi:hypothetical protein KL905_000623 [Ogataea polymorpha]|nr:hypothetical protein KL935_002096 [Ogataea polymorpha]KAG7910653.1 hypothetical protein KL907_001544 [Ogataea polymorpha]KAG7911171.1 hypothetical protein KL906_001551 [Ogataea polymorpha]KAG7923405.1 hypothetical protein KL905_000623 [Ogataea polymorpha]KAG7931684.1 hypothetical protein KL934_004096 [Ogataea polymorpha]